MKHGCMRPGQVSRQYFASAPTERLIYRLQGAGCLHSSVAGTGCFFGLRSINGEQRPNATSYSDRLSLNREEFCRSIE
jgi:hypothetical protein